MSQKSLRFKMQANLWARQKQDSFLLWKGFSCYLSSSACSPSWISCTPALPKHCCCHIESSSSQQAPLAVFLLPAFHHSTSSYFEFKGSSHSCFYFLCFVGILSDSPWWKSRHHRFCSGHLRQRKLFCEGKKRCLFSHVLCAFLHVKNFLFISELW